MTFYSGPSKPCGVCGDEANHYFRDGRVLCDSCYWDGPPREEDHPHDGDWRTYKARLLGGENG